MKSITKINNDYTIKDCVLDKTYLNKYYQGSFIVSDEVGGWIMAYSTMYNNSNAGKAMRNSLFTECIKRYSTKVELPDGYGITTSNREVNEPFNTLGIFLYDKLVIPNPKIDFGIQTYKFKLAIVNYIKSTYYKKYYDICEFIYTCNLQDYMNKNVDNNDYDTFTNYNNLLQDAAPHLYKECLERIERKINKIHKDFTIVNCEFIQISENCDEFDNKLIPIEYGINKDNEYYIVIDDKYQQIFSFENDYNEELNRLHYMQPINLIDLAKYKKLRE